MLLLLLAVVQVAQRLGPSVEPLGAQPPNVLMIVLDDVGVDLVGSYAANYPTLALDPCTPNIDHLASAGVRFTNAWSNPLCSPTRAQIMTGRPGSRTGVGNITHRGLEEGNHGIQGAEITLPEVLTGYSAMAVGKWHLSDPFQDGDTYPHPLLAGFSSYAGTLYGLETEYDHWIKCVSPPGILIPDYTLYATTDTQADALAAIDTLHEPWLLLVGFNAAHSPFHCPQERGFVTSAGEPHCSQNWQQDCTLLLETPMCVAVGTKPCQARAMVHAMDILIGELLEAIDPTDTAVFLIGDNGTDSVAAVAPWPGIHGKTTLFQGGINVPLIAHVPGGARGVSHELVSAADLFATVADVGGVTLPADPLRDSVSLLPTILSPTTAKPPRAFVYSEHFAPNFIPVAGTHPPGYEAKFHNRAIRDDRYKLIEMHGKDAAGNCRSEILFFRLAEEGPEDPALGPDPFELDDLMLTQTQWTPDVQSAFAELALELSTEYPRLPTVCD
jgi:arylsulfatase B